MSHNWRIFLINAIFLSLPQAVRGPTWSCIASEVRLHRSVSDEQLLLGKRQLLAVVLSYFESTREHRVSVVGISMGAEYIAQI